eukprot:m.66787 g.66787  ORF g.66787 m.66787 type:complete len:437 (-) comp7423_c0_seq1:241-1551(-)
MELTDLPTELLARIFAHFDVYELLTRLARVCRLFRDVALSPALWTRLDLEQIRLRHHRVAPTASFLMALATRSPHLQHLRLSGCRLVNDRILHRLAEACPHVQSLDLGFTSDVSVSMLLRALTSWSKLRDLCLEDCSAATDDLFMKLPREFLEGLETINIACCPIGDITLANIARSCPRLRAINIDHVPAVSSGGVAELARLLAPTLREVRLDGADLFDEVIFSLGAHCAGTLETLSISFCEQLTDACLPALVRLTRLRTLRLRKTDGISESALHAALCGAAFPHLQRLELVECVAVSDEVLSLLVEGSPRLQIVVLAWCWHLSDAGLVRLASCRELVFVDLTGIKSVTDATIREMADNLGRLKVLILKQCNYVTDQLLFDIVVRRGFVIVDYYGQRVGDESEAWEEYLSPSFDPGVLLDPAAAPFAALGHAAAAD